MFPPQREGNHGHTQSMPLDLEAFSKSLIPDNQASNEY